MRYLITALLLLLCATTAPAGVFVGFGQSGGTGGESYLGEQSTISSYFTSFTGPGQIILWRMQASGSGYVSSFHYYMIGMANWIGIIYSDNSGEPGTLIGRTPSNAGQGFSVDWDVEDLQSPVALTDGTYYWLGLQVSTNTDMQYRALQNLEGLTYTTTFGDIPSSWPTGSDSAWHEAYGIGVMYVH